MKDFPDSHMHIGDLDASTSGKKNWTATVTFTVHYLEDMSHELLDGATVFGSWLGDSQISCQTNHLGQCQLSKTTKNESLTFEVENIVKNGFEYLNEHNHDSEI